MNIDELCKWDKKGVDELMNTVFKPADNNHTIWDNINRH